MEKSATVSQTLLDAMPRKQYKITNLGRILHRVEIAHITNIGVVTMEKVIALSIVAYFGNIEYSEKIVGSVLQLCLFVLTLKYVMANLATD